MNIWERMEKIDRRWIYLLVAIAVIIPFIIPVRFPVSVTPETKDIYDYIQAMPDSSVVILSFDYYPSTLAETQPMAIAAMNQFFRKDMKVITLSNIPLGGPSLAELVTREVAKEYHKVYGVDYVNLGYKANYVAVLKGMGTSIESIFPTDNSGTPLKDLPLMQKVKNYSDVKFIFDIADNATADYWVSIVNAGYGVPMAVGATAVMAPKLYAYVGAKQIVGLLGGMKGAAEYEILLNKRASAFRGMDIQSLVHFLIIGLVILGNVGYFAGRRYRRKAGL
jgi:hypothetical protein